MLFDADRYAGHMSAQSDGAAPAYFVASGNPDHVSTFGFCFFLSKIFFLCIRDFFFLVFFLSKIFFCILDFFFASIYLSRRRSLAAVGPFYLLSHLAFIGVCVCTYASLRACASLCVVL